MRCFAVLCALVATCEAFHATTTVAPRTLTIVEGRNDKKTKRGKIYAHSNGNSRQKPKKSDEPVDPCVSPRRRRPFDPTLRARSTRTRAGGTRRKRRFDS